MEEIGRFLVAMDGGSIRRASSAVPLAHDLERNPAVLDRIEAAYAARGLPPAFRMPDAPGLEGLRAALLARGYTPEQPTLVKLGRVSDLIALAEPAVAADAPDESWAAVFLGPGFDPRDGAFRVRNLSRSPGAVFASVREEGEAVAVGAGAFGHGFLSIHGMRTRQARRGEGLAGRVLAALGAAARARGVERAFLQVEEGNAPARALYARAGFTFAWRYFYWSRRQP